MDVRELTIPDTFEFTPRQHPDDRGVFLEWFKAEELEKAVGHRLSLVQANTSVSRRGSVRGVHYADVPPSQAKYVTCTAGALLDVVVDIRVGSPTYGRSEAVLLDTVDRKALYIAEGLGHAFMALQDDTAISYLCSAGYNPSREHGVTPLDPALGIDWPGDIEPLLSPKDADAPTLAEAQAAGLLPSYEQCLAFYDSLRAGG
jgi:dTDP-4-dehydrorhamnose 3,5-epimerase